MGVGMTLCEAGRLEGAEEEAAAMADDRMYKLFDIVPFAWVT